MKGLISRYFEFKKLNTSLRVEIIAGITIFLTMLYIVPLNAEIMKTAGMSYEAVITATAVVTIIATIFTGLWAKTPIAMSVGLGLNSYFAIVLVQGYKLPWQTVLGIVFFSGIVFLLLTITKVRALIVNSIIPEFRIAISAGIGLFIAFIGLSNMKIIAKHPVTLITIGNLGDKNVLLGVVGLFVVMILIVWKVRGAFIISVAITTVVGIFLNITKAPQSVVSMPASMSPIFMQLDLLSALKPALIAPIITFMLTDLFDSLGTLAGVGYRVGMFEDGDNKPVQKTLEVDALATVAGSMIGVSTTTSFIESAAGVEEGGRSGFTAVVTGLCFVLTLFLLPLFKAIPATAIYPILVIVGFLMFADLKNINFSDLDVGIPAFFIIIIMPFTFSITRGLAAGFISYVIIKLVKGKIKELNPVVVVLAVISVLAFVFEK